MNADYQPPGRDLDEMIQQSVLGWKYNVDAATSGTVSNRIGPREWVRGDEKMPYNEVPMYSTDDQAAVHMLHEAFPDGHTVTPGDRGDTTVTIGAHASTGGSLALAACRAALKAKGWPDRVPPLGG